MWKQLLHTEHDLTPTLARVALGLAILPHGLQKLVGWFGGGGIGGTVDWFAANLGIPIGLTLLVIAAESIGAAALVVGVFGRVAALGIIAVMLGAVALVHLRNGFFMNWTGVQPGEGFEYHLLAVGLALVVLIKGSGAWSVDQVVAKS